MSHFIIWKLDSITLVLRQPPTPGSPTCKFALLSASEAAALGRRAPIRLSLRDAFNTALVYMFPSVIPPRGAAARYRSRPAGPRPSANAPCGHGSVGGEGVTLGLPFGSVERLTQGSQWAVGGRGGGG